MILLTTFCWTATYAQTMTPSVLNASGGSKTLNGNTYEYSIGEMTIVHTASQPNLVVTQGILQPADNKETGIAETSILAEELNVFPNPFQDLVYLRPHWETGGILNVIVSDISGREILRQSWTLQAGNEQQSIRLSQVAAGTYMLSVEFIQKAKSQSGVFKIQKLK